MSRINLGRVVHRRVVAGLIINVGEFILNGIVIGEQMNAVMAAINKPPIDGRHDHVLRAVRVWPGVHARVDLRRHPPAVRCRHQDGDLRVHARLGSRVPLSKSLHDHHQPFPARHDRARDGLGPRESSSRASPAHGLYKRAEAEGSSLRVRSSAASTPACDRNRATRASEWASPVERCPFDHVACR